MLSHLSLAVRGVCGSAESLRDLVHWEVFGGGEGFWQVAGRIGRGLIVAGSLPGDASGILRTQQGSSGNISNAFVLNTDCCKHWC